ncbi:hypothetical protein CAPN001_08610 [Capnocytophaga stomatis]|uniref:hypothetical protein n=1 Tax=Capnocytophaga stomatis TaxID=1848904 RepID=UPI00194FE065|nr:hypothetical protein [Capnocytophaga stomatis]GIJ93000.1 hypothetical protein CAPN002_02180 [Capnocytophaga stomatis]GIJ96292.1 hypothetical protein CAPN001_08610 [Capnocytophaga stomatis]
MIFKKSNFQLLQGSILRLDFQNQENAPKTFVYEFYDLKESLFLSSAFNFKFEQSQETKILNQGLVDANPEDVFSVVIINGDSKSVKLFECPGNMPFSHFPTRLEFPFDGVFLLTNKFKILVTIPAACSGFVQFDSPNYMYEEFVHFKSKYNFNISYNKKILIHLPKNSKKLIPVNLFDNVIVSSHTSFEGSGHNLIVNGFERPSNSRYLCVDFLKDSSFYEIENKNNFDVYLCLQKNVYNSDTFRAYQYYLDRKILHMSINLRNDFHNTMSKIYFGELPDIEKLQSERQLLLHSDFNEANKGYYDDYEHSVPSDEELQGAFPLPS